MDSFISQNSISCNQKNWIFFVSCRGKNNPVDYTLRSLENGKICIIDTETMKVIKSFEGSNLHNDFS